MLYVSTYWDACSISDILSQYVLVDRKLSFVKNRRNGTIPTIGELSLQLVRSAVAQRREI